MAVKTVFKRYELKYMITEEQRKAVLEAMSVHMKLDKYGKTTIRNLYFDTDTYLLIRRSIEKPKYKEKLRVRSYCRATDNTPVFIELKKKYNSVVYKRRLVLPYKQAIGWLTGELPCMSNSQISKEIEYFLNHYGNLHPAIFLSYDREAYFMKDGSDFRVTFDNNIQVRQTDLCLTYEADGTPILPEDTYIMEIKCNGGIPIWMTDVLSHEHIYKTSFSKYGTAYRTLIFPELLQNGGHYDD